MSTAAEVADIVSAALDDESSRGWQTGYDEGVRDGFEEGREAGRTAASNESYDDGYSEGYKDGQTETLQNVTWNLDWVGSLKPGAFCPEGPHKLGANAGSCDFCTAILPVVNRG